MLEITRQMFTVSVQSLRQSDSAEVGVEIYAMDQKINQYEQDVRRNVLKHLAITGGTNIIPGLILTSIVIDIEPDWRLHQKHQGPRRRSPDTPHRWSLQ